MLSLRSSAAIDLAEPLGRGALFGGRGGLLYAATLVVAALLFLVRFARFYALKQRAAATLETPFDCEADDWLQDARIAELDARVEDDVTVEGAGEDTEEPVAEAPLRLAVYDFDETLTRATYPQAYDGTPFGCMALNIPWEDPRAGAKLASDASATKEFGGFDDARLGRLQAHLAAMRAQGWTPCVLSYNLQWDKDEFCLVELLRHYGLARYFTHQGTPLVYGLRDMRRVGATSKGDFVVKMVTSPQVVTGLNLEIAPRCMNLLVDDDEVNIAGARACGILAYQVAKRSEWDGLVGGLGRADPHDFAKLEAIGPACGIAASDDPVTAGKRRRRRRPKAEGRSSRRG